MHGTQTSITLVEDSIMIDGIGNGDGIMSIVMVEIGIVIGTVVMPIGILGISILGMDIGTQTIGTIISGTINGIMPMFMDTELGI
jgi:hypothetical protein